IEPALANTISGELAGVGRQRGEFDTFELGGDIEAGQRIKRIQAAFDANRRVFVDFTGNIDFRGFRRTAVDSANLTVELLNRRSKVGRQAKVGKVSGAIGNI